MTRLTTILALAALASACKGRDEKSEMRSPAADRVTMSSRNIDLAPAEEPSPDDGEDASGGTGEAMALDEGKMGKRDDAPMRNVPSAPKASSVRGKGAPDRKPAGSAGQSSAETSVRAWFPETFLFEPRVVTDDQGQATVPVRVPDRLTTWRVLALAHARQGAQAGAVTSFLGTLPAYVDLVVPKFLVVGDELRLPVQLVNTTDAPITSTLELSATGARLTARGGVRTIPAQGSVVEYATLRAERAGTIEVRAGLAGTDAVVNTIEVRPAGRPATVARSGTLAAPRELTLEGPAGSDPATDRVRLLVFPGALALLRSELAVATARGELADDAYALLLAGRAGALLASLGDTPDPEAIRTLSLLTAQRAIRHGRTLSVERASLLVEAALAHPHNPIVARLGERAAAYLAQQQRPDGTFAGGTGWTLQRVLVATADATRAVQAAHLTTTDRQRAQGVKFRARGAFERNAEHVQDPYTAAAILATEAVDGPLADKLRELVRAAIRDTPDGDRYVEVPAGVVRADGRVPGRAEATALAVLALAGDPKAPLADLGGTLLGAYGLAYGWGDGRANLVCMQAVLALFKTPVPEGVKVTLYKDGAPITEGTLDRAALREVLALEADAPGLAGAHAWKVVAEPAVPGLGFALELRGWVPWQKQATTGGVEMTLSPAPVAAEVGKPVTVTLAAIAPSSTPITIVQSLPAGVQVDPAPLQALVTDGALRKFEIADGKLTLEVTPLDPGETFSASLKLIPTLAGTLRSAASTITAGGTRFDVPPVVWTVR